jgi:hypothetical protein
MEIASSVMVAGTFEDYRILFENCMDMTIGFRRKSVTLCLTFLTSPCLQPRRWSTFVEMSQPSMSGISFGTPMQQYCVLASGPTLITAADDAGAIRIARQFLHGELEIWQGKRLVAKLVETTIPDPRKQGAPLSTGYSVSGSGSL